MKENMSKDIEALRQILKDAKHAVFFGGAGMSTESGIPDFRGTGGLYTSEGSGNEYYLSRRCLTVNPLGFYKFYKENMIFPDAKPNRAHYALAKLEGKGIIKAVITQNIDGLHQAAGSQRVIELHGTVSRSYCMRCGKIFEREYVDEQSGVPKCSKCGGIVRPDVTLYGESLDGFTFRDAENEVAAADVLIVGGSSLTVFPAASLVENYEGRLIIINYSPTAYDSSADHVIHESVSDVLWELSEVL